MRSVLGAEGRWAHDGFGAIVMRTVDQNRRPTLMMGNKPPAFDVRSATAQPNHSRRATTTAAQTMGSIAMTNAFRHIRHTDGRAYYEGKPLSLADAQIMLNDDIVQRTVRVGAYLRVDESGLVLEAAPMLRRLVNRPGCQGVSPCAGQPG